MNSLCRTAAALLGAALFDILPQAELFGGGETDAGFYYQFFSDSVPIPETARMLEERMRFFLKEGRQIKEIEMVAFSAREMFLKRGHQAAADALEDSSPKELVSVVKIGEFYDLAEGPFASLPKDGFQIVSIESMGDGEYRVEGCAAVSKEELKAFLRKKADYQRSNHFAVGNETGLWKASSKGVVWREPGLKAKRDLLQRLQKEFCIGEEVAAPSLELLDELIIAQGINAFWLYTDRLHNPEGMGGLFEECCQSHLEQIIYCKESQFAEVESSLLQRIDKTLIILGFPKGEKGSRRALLEWTVPDGLGRSHSVISLRVEKNEKGTVLRAKLGIERIFALLLERGGKQDV
ncbi:MAG TPA: hypothetical protein VGM34_03045 [Chlamydiales bacterium]|jgi:hypothetical protein